MKRKIKNPLLRRIPRELLGDWRKYLVVSLFLILTIGFVSGMYVANESMLTAADSGADTYSLTKRRTQDCFPQLPPEKRRMLRPTIWKKQNKSLMKNLRVNLMKNLQKNLTQNF